MVALAAERRRQRVLHDRLLAAHGPQGWWPGSSPFEIMAGAVLVQRTLWRHAAAALEALRAAGLLDAAALAAADLRVLERAVRAAGCYRQKARALVALARFVTEAGGTAALADRPTARLRADLLGVRGVGPETADCILLYVYGRPVFVADAYALRLYARLGWLADAGLEARYAPVHARVGAALAPDAALLAELHALLVVHGQRWCRAEPRCAECPLCRRCAHGRRRAEQPVSPGSRSARR